MKRVALGIGLGTWMLALLTAGTVSARQPLDLCRIESEAEAIRCLADALRPELRQHFHCSCLSRQLNAARNNVESAARRVRAAARSRSRVCDLPQEVACLSERVSELGCLLNRARGFRRDFGPQGLDFACVSRVEQILAAMSQRTALLEALVGTGYPGGGWDSGWNGGWGLGAGYSEPNGFGYSGPTGWGYSGLGGFGYAGPGGFAGMGLIDSQTLGGGFLPPPQASIQGNVLRGREIERNRTVTRSRELQKVNRNR